MINNLKYFSTFSGIGGFELGIQQAYEELYNMGRATGSPDTENGQHQSLPNISDGDRRRTNTCVGFSEIDKYAIKVYNKQFNHKNYGDITKINAEELPDFDLLVGGFPCQSFSIAGKRGGFNDTRGTLFFEIARIVKQKQPRLLLLENVKGLLSHDKGRTFTTIISTLDELGYDCQWQVLNSKNFGVPQNRERVFIIGHLRGTSRPEVFPIGGSEQETVNKETGSIQANCLTATCHKGAGNDGMTLIVKEATKKGYAVAEEGDSINLSVPNSKTRRGRVGKGVAQTIDTGMQQHTLQDAKIRRLTPVECERLQGFPDNWTKIGLDVFNGKPMGQYGWLEVEISDTQRYKMCGNAVTVNVIKEIFKKLI